MVILCISTVNTLHIGPLIYLKGRILSLPQQSTEKQTVSSNVGCKHGAFDAVSIPVQPEQSAALITGCWSFKKGTK